MSHFPGSRGPDRVPGLVARITVPHPSCESGGPAEPARPSIEILRVIHSWGDAYCVAAASVMAWQTFSGVDLPRNSATVASLMAAAHRPRGRLVEVELHERGGAATGQDRLEVRVGDRALRADDGREADVVAC